MSQFIVKSPNIKVPRYSSESKYRFSKHDLNHADTTKACIYAAWTQGSLAAPRIGECFTPEHPPLPQLTLNQWITKINEAPGASTKSVSPPPQIEKLRSFSSIDAMEDESREDSDNEDGALVSAAAIDDLMKQVLHGKISASLPTVCNSFEVD